MKEVANFVLALLNPSTYKNSTPQSFARCGLAREGLCLGAAKDRAGKNDYLLGGPCGCTDCGQLSIYSVFGARLVVC
jgi:hypothetical protein